MTQQPKQRWIAAIVTESATALPLLPWERAAKRVRRLRNIAGPALTSCA